MACATLTRARTVVGRERSDTPARSGAVVVVMKSSVALPVQCCTRETLGPSALPREEVEMSGQIRQRPPSTIQLREIPGSGRADGPAHVGPRYVLAAAAGSSDTGRSHGLVWNAIRDPL